MLACLCCRDCVHRMEGVRRYNVNDIYISRVREALHVVISENVLIRKTEISRPLLTFFFRTGHNTCEAAILRLAQRWPEFACAVAPKPDERYAQFTILRLGPNRSG